MLPALPGILAPWVALACLIVVAARLRLFSAGNSAGRLGFVSGSALILISCSWQTVRLSTGYGNWFVITAYRWIDLTQFLVLALGLYLIVAALSRYARSDEDRREQIVTREERLRILENLQHDSRRQQQLLELLNLTLKEILSGFTGCAGAVFLINRGKRQFVLGAFEGLQKNEIASLEHYPLDHGLLDEAVELGEPLLAGGFEFVGKSGEFAESRFHASLILPLISGLEKIGAVVLLAEDTGRFGRTEVRFLAPVAEWLSEKIRSARLARELTLARSDVERMSRDHDAMSARLNDAVAALTSRDQLAGFCRSLVGLMASASAGVLEVRDARLHFVGSSEPSEEFSENYRTALIDAMNRKKPLIINQESEDESGRSRVVLSSLLYPVPGKAGQDALLLRRDSGVFAVHYHDLKDLELFANIAGLLLDYREISRRDISSRIGFDKIVKLLRVEERGTDFERDPGFFVRQIAGFLPESIGAVMLVRTADETYVPRGSVRLRTNEFEEIAISAGESFIGEAAAMGTPRFVVGRDRVEALLSNMEPINRGGFQRLFGEQGTPSFVGICPLAQLERVVGIAVVFDFSATGTERDEWERMLTLAAGLFSLRLTIASMKRESSSIVPSGDMSASAINELNNHLGAVIGMADLAARRNDLPGELQLQLRTIASEAEKAVQFAHKSLSARPAEESSGDTPDNEEELFNAEIERVLRRVCISGNLHMAGGRPREIDCTLGGRGLIKMSGESVQQLLESLLDRFAATAADEDKLTLATYVKEGFFYFDISRHRRNFPPVQRVADFGEYHLADEAFRARPAEVYLLHVAQSSCHYAFDRSSPTPAYLSFRFPLTTAVAREEKKRSQRATRILAIDDQTIILDLITAMCQSLGYEVVTATSGRAGVQLARKERFDIVLTDLAMPDMSGLETAKQIRAIHPTIPIILVTGWEASIDPQQLTQAGISEVLYKPFRIEQLTDIVRSAAAPRSRA